MSESAEAELSGGEIVRELRALCAAELPAWLLSMILHMLLIIGFGLCSAPEVKRSPFVALEFLPTIEELEVEPPVEVRKQQFLLVSSELPEVGSVRTAGGAIAAAMQIDPLVKLPDREPQVDYTTERRVPRLEELMTAPNESSRVQMKGVAGDGATGTLGALDRITQEILRSLEIGPTLVVWCFDRSGSMQVQRQVVGERFEKIYEELGVSHLTKPRAGNRQPLLTSLVSFGSDVRFLTDVPTDDVTRIRDIVATIPNDDSGIELTFTALGMAAQKYEPLRRARNRRVMLVAFTDEVGDDDSASEECLAVCKRNQMPVYVVGVPAPFGRPNIEVKYVDPDPAFDQSVQWIPIRQGSETYLPEQVQLNFTGHTNHEDGIYRLDSGFGPYCLTRLCYETGGIFFAVHGNRERIGQLVRTRETPVFQARLNYFFDPLVMKPYRPDYLAPSEYLKSISRNKAKAALVDAARRSIVEPMESPVLVFRRQRDETEAALKRALSEAQKKAAILAPHIDDLYTVLKQGAKDRESLVEPRWRAGFDLAYGRVLAVKVRTDAYNQLLARAKNGLHLEDPETDKLTLVPVDEVPLNSTLDSMAKQARALLEGVVREHPGTPWAMSAAEELKQPIGWKWVEANENPRRPPQPEKPVVVSAKKPDPPRAKPAIPKLPRPRPVPAVARKPQKPAAPRPPDFRRETPKPIRQNVKL
jgi:hypothetical protein